MLLLCCPTLKRYDLCLNMLRSAYEGTNTPDRYIIVDNGGAFSSVLEEAELPIDIDLIVPDTNIGVASSWNVFLSCMFPDDVCLIVNDDVAFHEDTIKKLYNAYLDNPNELIYVTENSGLNAFSCFLITPKAVNIVGYFDEQFFPAYFEDGDYAYRLRLTGHDLIRVPCTIREHTGSATIKAYSSQEMQKHHEQFRANEVRYIRKWGGLPSSETFKTAFNQ